MDFEIFIETENFLLEIYPSVGTAILVIVVLALGYYTVRNIARDIKEIRTKRRLRKENKK